MKPFTLCLCTILFLGFSVQSQNYKIIGSVHSPNGKTLTNAHILDINSRVAVATDELGKFQLSVADSGTVLRISHVGFRPLLYAITEQVLQEKVQSIKNVSIILSQEATMLSSAVVSANDKTVIDGKRGVVLRDFSFTDGNNLLLMAENGIRHLVLCNPKWQEISRIQVGKKGDKLYEDCLGNVHLFGNDSVYQIQIIDNELSFISTSDLSYFLKQMAHCATSTESHIFFSSYQKAGQEVYHYGLKRQTKEGVILQRVYDHQGLQDIEDYFSTIASTHPLLNGRPIEAGTAYRNQRLEQQTITCSNSIGSNGYAYAPYGRFNRNAYRYRGTPAAFQRSWLLGGGRFSPNAFGNSQSSYFQSVSNRALEYQQAMLNTWSPSPRDRGWIDLLRQPTYSPMFNLRDSIFVFDHVIGVCFVHDENGKEIRSFPIEHQETKGWRNMLLPDENGENVYAQIKLRNKIFLMQIDLNDGHIVKSTQLPNATFVEHLKIKDGYAYYLKEYQDLMTSDRMLKQRL